MLFLTYKEYRRESAKLLATILLTLRGTPYIYQGEEIGMTNVAFETIEDYRDLSTIFTYHSEVSNGVASEDILDRIHSFSRDNARTPMQWDASENAGFTKGTPWIRVNSNYKEIDVAEAEEDEKVFAYLRTDGTEKYLEVLNFSEDDTRFLWPEGNEYKSCGLVISNYAEHDSNTVCDIKLRPFEAGVYKVV